MQWDERKRIDKVIYAGLLHKMRKVIERAESREEVEGGGA